MLLSGEEALPPVRHPAKWGLRNGVAQCCRYYLDHNHSALPWA